ncbi:11206_t:CDS:1, partial [Gigaspora margarita]
KNEDTYIKVPFGMIIKLIGSSYQSGKEEPVLGEILFPQQKNTNCKGGKGV